MRKIFVRYWIAPAAWLSALVVYLLTLCPTVYVEGSGELIGAVHFLGTAHPTGYPLFSLIRPPLFGIAAVCLGCLQNQYSNGLQRCLRYRCFGALAAL